ncbi:sulfatase S1_7 [Babesia caballi]|uniref:Sulfatase S1_7 n=1 Tax=Babesia caballi TaxID=5871 RepID=A0AAV4LXC4_BABCB|nr:sulfatase S1_7 [Babesia caballi]
MRPRGELDDVAGVGRVQLVYRLPYFLSTLSVILPDAVERKPTSRNAPATAVAYVQVVDWLPLTAHVVEIDEGVRGGDGDDFGAQLFEKADAADVQVRLESQQRLVRHPPVPEHGSGKDVEQEWRDIRAT